MFANVSALQEIKNPTIYGLRRLYKDRKMDLLSVTDSYPEHIKDDT